MKEKGRKRERKGGSEGLVKKGEKGGMEGSRGGAVAAGDSARGAGGAAGREASAPAPRHPPLSSRPYFFAHTLGPVWSCCLLPVPVSNGGAPVAMPRGTSVNSGAVVARPCCGGGIGKRDGKKKKKKKKRFFRAFLPLPLALRRAAKMALPWSAWFP